jgi:electron transfer flavoprotein alpha subunit
MANLVIAEHDNTALNDATRAVVTAAKAIGGDVHVLVAGKDAGAVAEAASKLDGVAKVLHANPTRWRSAGGSHGNARAVDRRTAMTRSWRRPPPRVRISCRASPPSWT